MRLLEKLGYGKGSGGVLRVVLFQWAIILFLVAGPIVWPKMDEFITLLCRRMAADYKPYIDWIFGAAVLLWGLNLYGNYRESRATKFDMESMLDRDEADLQAQGKDTTWVEKYRQTYRRRHFVSILTSGITAAALIMYYEIWLFLIHVLRRGLVVTKGTCGALTFAWAEKLYLKQFLDDLPFKLSSIINIFGDCRPNDDLLPIRIMTSLANMLHWALIIGVAGFIWGKQIKTWLLEK